MTSRNQNKPPAPRIPANLVTTKSSIFDWCRRARMTSRNQNKPPAPRSPANKNRVVEDAPLDKRRKVGNCRMMASTTTGRSRQPLAPVSTQKDVAVAPSQTEGSECESIEFTKEKVDALLNERFKGKKFDSKGKQQWMTEYMKKLKVCIKWYQKDVAVAPSETEGSECESIEFTKEEVDALLNERFKGKKFDSKGKQEWMREYMNKLKVCIKWYQKGLEDFVEEKNNLCKMLDSSERKCVEAEAAMKVKEEELNATISTLKESLAKEESEKFDALECHKREKESRIAAEKNQDSLREELAKAEQNASKANEKVKAQEDTCLQEC